MSGDLNQSFRGGGRSVEFLDEINAASLVALVEAYHRAQGTFRSDDAPMPSYNTLLELDLATVVPSVAGPRRPQDRVRMRERERKRARARARAATRPLGSAQPRARARSQQPRHPPQVQL